MNVDKALADFKIFWILRSGDTGRRKVEHRNFLQLMFTHQSVRRRLWAGRLDIEFLYEHNILNQINKLLKSLSGFHQTKGR